MAIYTKAKSSVTLGNFFDFFFLFQGIWWLEVSLFTVDDFISQTFSNGSLVSHWLFSASVTDQINGQVDSSHWWDVDGLLSGNTSCSNLGWIFSWTSELDGLDEDFQWVSSGQKVNNFEGMSDDSDSINFFTGVSAVELQSSDQSFNNWGKCFSELFGLISASSMGNEDLRFGWLDSDVILETWVVNLEMKKEVLGNRHSSILRKAWGRFRIRWLMIFIRRVQLLLALTFVVKW